MRLRLDIRWGMALAVMVLALANAVWTPVAEATETLTLQAVTVIELAPADVCANCGARLLEELKAKDQA